MPPVLGWAAVTGEVAAEALLLFLIIFAWTPPHFWSLALYRTKEYAKAGVPMLPVTHGEGFTRLHVLLYTVILFAVTCCRSATRMSGVDLSGKRDRARRCVPGLRHQALLPVQRPAGACNVPLLDRVPRAAVHGAAD